ncbi:ComEA family DNA-binding protein [Saccharopolyspora sp. 6V]|uniref:ComEA family DNA-binding protein n=2 Tax=unclassified Saccharopolyspora TaxID=2646250 RepID=UPI001CD6B760|nr:ComEA family DNA-binding protein [Saccharopolyspora sp. 6V]MCA1194672.1 ComEA family DNA-binding protein [Saccharopolyspora sp. 6V]
MAVPTLFRGILDDSAAPDDTPRSRLLALKQQAERDGAGTGRALRFRPSDDEITDPPDVAGEPESRAGPDSTGRHSAREPSHGQFAGMRRHLQRWLPDSVLRARIDPGRAGRIGLLLAAVLALLAVAVTTWLDRPVAEPAPPPPLPLAAAPAAPEPPPPPPELVISVVGEVTRPGLVAVPPGSRVADAVRAASGTTGPEVDITALNLARRLTDGEQLYVAVPVPPGADTGQAASPPGSGAAAKTDLNTATEEQLDALPGVGEVTAKRIVQWRTEHGRFGSVDELQDVDGIGAAKLAKLRDLVQV